MGIFDAVGGFLDDYAPIIGGGLSLYNVYQQNQSRDDYANLIQAQEQEKYDAASAERQHYLDYLDTYNGIAQQNAAISAGNSRAAAAAANATQNAKLAAGKRGKKTLKKQHKKSLGYLQPYIDAGLQVLPQHTQAAKQGIEGLGLLGAYLQTPEQMAKLNQSKPMIEFGADLKLPDHMRGA